MTVAITGGGIAGLAAGIALARAGHDVRIFEQAQELAEIGAGLQLAPNALKALAWLGVMPALERSLFHPRAIEVRDGLRGDVLATLPLETMRERHGAAYATVHRADLLATLIEGARAMPSIRFTTGARLEAAEQLERPLLQFGSGETVEVDALIGADGIHSTVRRTVFDDGPPQEHDETIWRALLPLSEVPAASADAICLWLLPGGHVVHYPVRAGALLNIVAVSTAGGEAPDMRCPIHPVLADIIYAPSSWLRWPSLDRDPSPARGRAATVLIGDAAHPALPYLAQGAAMALEDAVTLGEAVSTHRTFEAAFRAFEAMREARTTRIVRAARRQGRIDHLDKPWSVARNLAIRALPHSLLHRRLDWIFRWQPGAR
ncbi:MAG: FAD-dependent monooxygenase [Parvibaculaceae bacterium]